MSESGQDRSSRRIIEAKDIAKLDIGVSVMTIVVLGEYDSERTQEAAKPLWRLPADFCGMAPPDVQLTQDESGQCPWPGQTPKARRDDEIGHCAQKTVEQHRRIARNDRVVEE
jgi:hypothetical protein